MTGPSIEALSQATQWLLLARAQQILELGVEIAVAVDPPGEARTCPECDGIGATRQRGQILPCPACEGTGLQNASF